MSTEQNFLQRYGHMTLGEITADWQPAELPEDADWVRLPPADFLAFCRDYPRLPFDAIPPSAEQRKPASFLISQAHRLWLTTSLVHERLTGLRARNLLDLGSFPYFTPLILRDYFGYQGEITVTTNLDPTPETLKVLDAKRIHVQLLDLDPYVRDPADPVSLPRKLDAPDGSFDLIVSSHVIEHLYHPRVMLEECQRLLRPGGEVIITTDNAMMIDVFGNYIGGYGYTFEPVEQTAAMHFDFWRGHVRFFTERDLRVLLEKAGLSLSRTEYAHCFYNVLFEEYFTSPSPILPGWNQRMLAETPWLRNDIAVVGTKPG